MTPQKPLPEIITSEIALDGLEGITFMGKKNSLSNKNFNQNQKFINNFLDLCLRISHRGPFPSPLPLKIRESVWEFIKNSQNFRFYLLPTPRPLLKLLDRASLDALKHTKIEKDSFSSEIVVYHYAPIDVNDERGSCENYETRVETFDVKEFDSAGILERFGQTLVIVASQKLRNKVLGVTCEDVTLQQFCILERIGRSRRVGEFSAGPGTLQEILNTEKKVSGSYVMKRLVSRNLITKQEYRVERENVTKFIYHLPEFYTEMKSRVQILMENAVNYLKSCPNATAEIRDVRSALMTDQGHALRATKHPDFREITERIDLPYRHVYPDAPREKWQNKNQTERILNLIRLKNPEIETFNMFGRKTLEPDDDENDQRLLDIGNQKFDFSLLRQLYEYLDGKGPNGAKQVEVQTNFGLSRLNARSLIRTIEKHGVTDTFVVEEGRQRVKMWFLKKFEEERRCLVILQYFEYLLKFVNFV